jgi:hypothetical protein
MKVAASRKDDREANDLVDLLQLGRLAEEWSAPPDLRGTRRAGVGSDTGARRRR